MKRTLTEQLIESHAADGSQSGSGEIALSIDQTLTQDATGTLVMLALDALGIDRVATQLSAQYVDHNLLQTDNKNADDHLFLESACRRFGLYFSRPGGGVSHPLHMQLFGEPGKTLLGSDSHTCAAGSLGMLAIGAGGLDVAMAMTGRPFHFKRPRVWGVRLVGTLPPWVSAKDIILELLRRHGVRGGTGRILEYFGPGLGSLSAMDRHVIANMGAELGATTSVFPSDDRTREFLARHGREAAWRPLHADEGAEYDAVDEIDLTALEPLIAKPSSPGNVVPVRSVAGEPIYQAYIGSSANPGFRDFAISAAIVRGKKIAPGVSFDVNPTSRALLEDLVETGYFLDLLAAGARIHQPGCNGCIGMGQAPATGRNSLRTTPRNFPGRSGTREDSVWLCSPETATASALEGVIVDPRKLGEPYPEIRMPQTSASNGRLMVAPMDPVRAAKVQLVRGPNVAGLPRFEALPASLDVEVILKAPDDISTDEILQAGAEALIYRSNIPKLAEFTFRAIEPEYVARARASKDRGGHAIVAGANYGQGSSREHAALAPRYLGLRLVLAKSYARIHRQNLANFGVLPLTFERPEDYESIQPGMRFHLKELRTSLKAGGTVDVDVAGGRRIRAVLPSSQRELEMIGAGGLIEMARSALAAE
ncbi:MAG TPA: aconitate hydratase [Polyangiaceae bacterium]|nr:aconitate hydratase [Polyangiaceae bacterium]